MFEKFWRCYSYRNFSKSSFWRSLEKVKPPEPTNEEMNKINLDVSKTFVPNNFEKNLLLLSGKYKSKEEIPPRIGYETMNHAKAVLRIRLANVMMALTVGACIFVVFLGKKRQREGDTLLKRITERDDELREEGRLRQKK